MANGSAQAPERLSLKDVVLAAAMTIMVAVTSLQVGARYLLDSPLAWSEEVARYTMVWMAFLAGAWSVRDGEHIVVEAFMAWLPPRGLWLLAVLRHLFVAAFCLAVLPASLHLTGEMHAQLGVAIEIPLSLVFASLPLGLLMMAWYACRLTLRVWRVGDANTDEDG